MPAAGGKNRPVYPGQPEGWSNGRRRRRTPVVVKGANGFTRTASGTTATLLVEADLSSTSPRSSAPVYTDITLQAMQIGELKRGRAYELAETDTGSGSILLDDHDRAFDPLNTAGTYYPNVKPMRKTRVSVQMLGQTFRAFTGYALKFPPVWERPSWATVNVSLVDGFGPLALEDNLVAAFAQEDTGTRIGHVLDAIGFPAGDRIIDTGISQCAAVTFTAAQAQNALDHIRDCERTENGLFYFDGSGRAVFKNRQTVSRQTTPKAIFSDVGDLDFDDAIGDYSDRLIYNAVTVTDSAGNAVTVTDSTSQDAYWPRALTRDTLLPAGSAETTSCAQWLLALYKQPGFRFERLMFTASMHDKLMYEALTREIGDLIQVTFTPPGSAPTAGHKPISAVLDSFTGVDQNPLSRTGWTNKVISSDSNASLSSNQLSALSGNGSAYWNPQTFGPDSECFGTITVKPAAAFQINFYARLTAPGTTSMTGYAARITVGTPDTFAIIRRDTGNASVVLASATGTFTAGDKLGIRCVGSTIELWQYVTATSTWTLITSLTDATYSAGGYIGARISDATGRIDDFSGGTLAAVPISQNCIVQGIGHQVSPADDLLWVTTYELAPAPAVGLWLLETSALDTAAILSY